MVFDHLESLSSPFRSERTRGSDRHLSCPFCPFLLFHHDHPFLSLVPEGFPWLRHRGTFRKNDSPHLLHDGCDCHRLPPMGKLLAVSCICRTAFNHHHFSQFYPPLLPFSGPRPPSPILFYPKSA